MKVRHALLGLIASAILIGLSALNPLMFWKSSAEWLNASINAVQTAHPGLLPAIYLPLFLAAYACLHMVVAANERNSIASSPGSGDSIAQST